MAETQTAWRLIYNPNGDVKDIVAFGASVAEGRIAGKYQLSTTLVPDTMIIQHSREKGIIAGADVSVDKEAAKNQNIQIARMARQGRNSARPVGTVQLSELTSRASRKFEAVDVDLDEPAVLIYTSGTTGNPKGAMITHRNFHFQCTTIVPSINKLTYEDMIIGVLPLYHIYGLANSLFISIFNGGTLVMLPQYSPQGLLEAIEKHQATMLPAIPSMYQLLLGLARTKSRSAAIPKSLRNCISGGAPLSMAVLKQFHEVFNVHIREGYGLTESTSSVCANGVNGVYKEGSIGKPATGVEMKIIDENGAEVPIRAEGEICIRSTTITKGYWNNKEATDAVLQPDGWFLTGDLGYRDEDNFFFITDRKKDIIISHGYNISPREIEEVLTDHPKVLEAAVVNRKNNKGDESVTAFIVARPVDAGSEGKDTEPVTEKELREYCELNLAPYKRPRAYEFVDALPRSATGKVLRKELREEAEDRRLIEKRS